MRLYAGLYVMRKLNHKVIIGGVFSKTKTMVDCFLLPMHVYNTRIVLFFIRGILFNPADRTGNICLLLGNFIRILIIAL